MNGVHPCCPLFVLGVAFRSWLGWTGEEVSFWTRLPHCLGVVSDGEVESCPKRAHHQPDDHYGRVGGALSLYSPGLGAHSRRHLGGSRAYWTLSGFVGGRFPAANGPPVLVIQPSVGPAPPTSPPSLSVSEGTCHTPNPGPTRLADPNRFPGRETQDWDSLPDFFFFLKANWHLWVWPTSYNNSKYYIQVKRTTTGVVSIKIYTHITESHLHIQN